MRVISQAVELKQKKTVKVLSAVLALTAVMYCFFIIKSIGNVLVRQELHGQMLTLESEIGQLESQYLSLKGTIDEDYAYTLGFVASGNKHYTQGRQVVSVLQGENIGP